MPYTEQDLIDYTENEVFQDGMRGKNIHHADGNDDNIAVHDDSGNRDQEKGRGWYEEIVEDGEDISEDEPADEADEDDERVRAAEERADAAEQKLRELEARYGEKAQRDYADFRERGIQEDLRNPEASWDEKQALRQRIGQMQHAHVRNSFEMARESYGDEFDDAYAVMNDKLDMNNPVDHANVMQVVHASNPGRALMTWWRNGGGQVRQSSDSRRPASLSGGVPSEHASDPFEGTTNWDDRQPNYGSHDDVWTYAWSQPR
jgi:hypothetical protein